MPNKEPPTPRMQQYRQPPKHGPLGDPKVAGSLADVTAQIIALLRSLDSNRSRSLCLGHVAARLVESSDLSMSDMLREHIATTDRYSFIPES